MNNSAIRDNHKALAKSIGSDEISEKDCAITPGRYIGLSGEAVRE
jgi:type I restriction-modification system DNA methylase subunit